MKVLSKKDQEILSELFKELLKKKWKKSAIDTSLVEESMRVMTYSFDTELTRKDKKEIFNISHELVKEILLRYFKEEEYLNPIVVLASPTALHLCEIQHDVKKGIGKFSLVGKYSKKYKCTSAVFVMMAHSYHPKNASAYIISLAYDEGLHFEAGDDTSVVFCIPFFVNKKLKIKLLNLPGECPLVAPIVKDIRKPNRKITSLSSIHLN